MDEILKGVWLTSHEAAAQIRRKDKALRSGDHSSTQRSRKKSLLFPPMTSSLAADYRRLKQMKPVSSQSVELNSVCLSLVCSFACVFNILLSRFYFVYHAALPHHHGVIG